MKEGSSGLDTATGCGWLLFLVGAAFLGAWYAGRIAFRLDSVSGALVISAYAWIFHWVIGLIAWGARNATERRSDR